MSEKPGFRGLVPLCWGSYKGWPDEIEGDFSRRTDDVAGNRAWRSNCAVEKSIYNQYCQTGFSWFVAGLSQALAWPKHVLLIALCKQVNLEREIGTGNKK
jgi:hypothetical protein